MCEVWHEPETLGIRKVFGKQSGTVTINPLDYVFPQMQKLSMALQTRHPNLSVISSLVDVTLDSCDDNILSAANWVFKLLDAIQNSEIVAEEQVTQTDTCSFQEEIGEHFCRSGKGQFPLPNVWLPSALLTLRKYQLLLLLNCLHMERLC